MYTYTNRSLELSIDALRRLRAIRNTTTCPTVRMRITKQLIKESWAVMPVLLELSGVDITQLIGEMS